jgi:hypothetical protein
VKGKARCSECYDVREQPLLTTLNKLYPAVGHLSLYSHSLRAVDGWEGDVVCDACVYSPPLRAKSRRCRRSEKSEDGRRVDAMVLPSTASWKFDSSFTRRLGESATDVREYKNEAGKATVIDSFPALPDGYALLDLPFTLSTSWTDCNVHRQ